MQIFSKLPYLLLACLLMVPAIGMASYRIEGTVNRKGEWQPQIYLATIDKLDDYYNANAKFVINVAPIDLDGRFVIEGDNLPNDPQFYRLYVIKEEHSEYNACMFIGEEHNFIHLILDNDSKVSIQAATATYSPFGDYSIQGDPTNLLMRALSKLVYPSYLFYEMKFPSELRFAEDKLNRDLFNFADTCSSTLVSLAAINNTDYDAYFETKEPNYRTLQEQLVTRHPHHTYTKDYIRKMRYYGGDFDKKTSSIYKWLSLVLSFVVVGLLFWIYRLKRRSEKEIIGNLPTIESFQFTPQEIKILQAIKSGKTNKEIANDLFIEVSTVKSHINKLYAKFDVKNRKEAIEKAKLFIAV